MIVVEVFREAVPAHYDAIAAGIMAHNAAHTGEAHGQPLTVLAQRNQAVVGGLWGEVFWGWLKVELLWVQEDLRGQGLGRQLLRRAEAEAQREGATAAHLDTFSFQALEFYQREGYEIFGTLPDFPRGHTRYFLQKQFRPVA
ncbi:GNAT family N-acetyltransferase [Hymenobacter weizhouensis]|uniref:GNAT family N-acetyltransferase n=1 Tax=Hymenobacter sp. YIM 151500-1 TaxID=2987689 RepID=UPI002225BD49|nr:GNAT family N-acetyltransferase [Hymenobacter sp. YIM 151500-1]UYZ63798.1 GNAT family N-acetyltransferase [Hymenobacter sp. YIM 151500-1]